MRQGLSFSKLGIEQLVLIIFGEAKFHQLIQNGIHANFQCVLTAILVVHPHKAVAGIAGTVNIIRQTILFQNIFNGRFMGQILILELMENLIVDTPVPVIPVFCKDALDNQLIGNRLFLAIISLAIQIHKVKFFT